MGKSIKDIAGIDYSYIDSFEGSPMLIDPMDEMVVHRGVAQQIRMGVESGTMDAYDVSLFSYAQLRKVMTFYRIPGRSNYTRSLEMAERIVEFIKFELGKPKEKRTQTTLRRIVDGLPSVAQAEAEFLQRLQSEKDD